MEDIKPEEVIAHQEVVVEPIVEPTPLPETPEVVEPEVVHEIVTE